MASSGDGGLTYQASVMRQGFSPGAVVSDLWLHIANSFSFWKWPGAYFRVDRSWGYVLALLPVLAAILLLVPTAIHWENRSPRPFRVDLRLLVFACSSFGLLVASYLVILLLNGNHLLWRTEFLSSFAAACLGGTALYALLNRVQTTARRTVLAVVVTTFVGVFSVLAGVNSGIFFHELWERQRVAMSSIVANVPSVTDGTLFVIRNVDPQKDPFGHNMWFDLALRLAYPDKLVAGTYFFRDESPARGANIAIENGKPQLLPGGEATLFHSMPDPWIDRIIAFDYDRASGQAAPVPTGPVRVGNDEIPAVDYDFCDAIKGFEPDPVAVHRYGPITAENRINCQRRDAVRTASRDPNSRRAAAFADARSLSLATMARTSGAQFLRPNASGVAFRSAPEPWSSIAQMPLLAGCLAGGGWVAVDVLVTHGTIGIGVLNREGSGFLVGGSAASSENIQTVFLRLNSFAATGDLVLRNWMTSSTEGVLKAVRIAAGDGSKPVACDSDPARTKALARALSLPLAAMMPGSEGASLQAGTPGVVFRSAPDPWAYIGRMPLDAGCIPGGGWVAADIRVRQGAVGLGVLNRKGDDFLVRAPTSIGDEVQTIFLRLDSLASAGDLVLQNWDENSSAEGTLQSVRIAAADVPIPPACTQR